MNNVTTKFFVVIIFIALVISNIVAIVKIDELSDDISSINNSLQNVVNNYNNLSNDIYKLKSDTSKEAEEQFIASNVFHKISSKDESLQTAKLTLHFTMKNPNVNNIVSVELSSSFADEMEFVILDNGSYTVEFNINTSTNYKAILHIKYPAGNTQSVVLMENINADK